MNPGFKSTVRALAAGAGAYALGVWLGSVLFRTALPPGNQSANPATSPAGTTARALPPLISSNALAPISSSNAPAPAAVLLAALQKATNDPSAGFFDLHDNLCALLGGLSAEDFPQLWLAVRDSKSRAVREFARSDLMGAWAKLDPKGALAAAQTLANPDERDAAVSSVLAQWALKDRQSALQGARQLEPEGQRNWAVAMIILRLANANPEEAAGLLDQVPSGPARDRAASAVVGGMAGRNPAAAMAIAERIRSSSDRCLAFSYLAEALLARDPGQALEWAQSLPSAGDRTTALYIVLADTARSDPQRAVQLLMAQPARNREDLVTEVAFIWAGEDASAAARWACQLQAGEMQNNALRSIMRACPAEDLNNVADLALSLPDAAARSGALKELGKQWQQSLLLDARGALDAAERFPPGADRDAFLAGACSELHWDYPGEMAKLVEAIATPKLRDGAAEIAAVSWLKGDPDAASAWVAGLSAGTTRDRTVLALTEEWAATDPAAASQWLRTLPDDTHRSAAAEAFIAKALLARPDLAAAWLPAISEEVKRAPLARKISAQWLQKDPDAARAWLQAEGLPKR